MLDGKEEMKEHLIKNEDKDESKSQEEELEQMNRISEDINNDKEVIPYNEHEHDKPYTDLRNVPANVPIESLLGEDFLLVPNSTRKALIAKWNQNKKQHSLSSKDKKQLEERNLLERWENTVKAISIDKRKQPMNNTPPL